jgi:hypothetical protein
MTRRATGASAFEARLWALGILSGVYLLAFAMVHAARTPEEPAPRAAPAVAPAAPRAPTIRRVVRAVPKRAVRVRTRSS